MGKKGGIWRFLRSLRRRSSVTTDPLAGFVTVELRPEPAEPASTSTGDAAGTASQSTEPALTEVITHCVNVYIRPALISLTGDDSLIQHTTSRAVLSALAGYWLLAVCSSLILLVAALVAPALRSVRALESGDAESRRRWLRYWVVYGVVATVSIISDPLQGLIPGYWTAKTLLLLWCAAPYPWHGSDYVFYHLIAPSWWHLETKLQDLPEQVVPPGQSQ